MGYCYGYSTGAPLSLAGLGKEQLDSGAADSLRGSGGCSGHTFITNVLPWATALDCVHGCMLPVYGRHDDKHHYITEPLKPRPPGRGVFDFSIFPAGDFLFERNTMCPFVVDCFKIAPK